MMKSAMRCPTGPNDGLNVPMRLSTAEIGAFPALLGTGGGCDLPAAFEEGFFMILSP
jgi:hypothetical protein